MAAGIRGLAAAVRDRLIARLRSHPVLATAPLAAVAVAAGFSAQALLRPEPQQQELLEALIAQPGAAAPAATPAVPAPGTQAAATARAAATAAATASRAGAVPGTAADPETPAAARDPSDRPERLRVQRARGGWMAEPRPGPELPLEIRVALLQLSSQPVLQASGPWRLSDRSGQLLQSGSGTETVAYAAPLRQRGELWLDAAPGARLLADRRPYAGRMRLLRGNNGVLVVNHLPLESYVSSVVGGEMPSRWHGEALRAQAVAARSYAMVHMVRPANVHWHLGDTTRWQQYNGLSSVTAATLRATAGTGGIILTYQGGIVESLYAATQQIVEQAHGHLGASMSQTGAQELASQGLRYNEILGNYYQGASLARLQAAAR